MASGDGDVIIVGAGIGGLTAALALARSGYAPAVCERAADIGDVGGGITIRTNATRILDELGVLGDLDGLTARITSAVVFDRHGRLLRRWQLPSTGTDTITIRRTDLQKILLRHLSRHRHQLHTGFSFARFDQTPDRVAAHADDGRSIDGRALIGCDGLNSRVRTQLRGDGPPSYRGFVQWRFLAPKRHPVVGPTEKMDWFGRGLRFGASPLGPGMAWYVSVNAASPDWRGGERVREYLLGLFKGWANPITEMIAELVPEQLVWTSIYDRPPARRWGEDRVTLLGDAAHPFTPDLGLGGALAIEDAEALTRSMQDGDVIPALRRYEDVRRENAGTIGVKSRFTGDMVQWSNPLLVGLRDTLIAQCPEFLWQKQIRRTYM
jgi:2-polyprenyl-6-methoxyphenol hydroxylase-like FAD-dependent oxidoreductase